MTCLTTLLETETHYQAEILFKLLSPGQCIFFSFLINEYIKNSSRTSFCEIKVCFIMLHNNKLIPSHLEYQPKMCLLSSKTIYVLSSITQREKKMCLNFFNYLHCSSLAQKSETTMASVVKQVSSPIPENSFYNRQLRHYLLL